MKCNFVVGQKVMLVRQFGRFSLLRAQREGVKLPYKGTVYTIRGFDDQGDQGLTLAILLNEINNPIHYSNELEPAFCTSLFEAIVERKTDISIFTKMLRELHASI